MMSPSRTTSRAITRAATLAAAAASAAAYPFLPERVATHFDLNGKPDRYGSRLQSAVTIPAMMAGLALANDRFGGWLGGRDREDDASGAMARDEATALVELALLPGHLTLLARGAGLPVNMSRATRAIYGLLMIALGNVLPRLPRNGLIGIRTPWTLADPAVWERTNRLGGYLLTAAGAITVASLPATGKRTARIPLIATLGAIGLATVYSFVAYLKRPRS